MSLSRNQFITLCQTLGKLTDQNSISIHVGDITNGPNTVEIKLNRTPRMQERFVVNHVDENGFFSQGFFVNESTAIRHAVDLVKSDTSIIVDLMGFHGKIEKITEVFV